MIPLADEHLDALLVAHRMGHQTLSDQDIDRLLMAHLQGLNHETAQPLGHPAIGGAPAASSPSGTHTAPASQLFGPLAAHLARPQSAPTAGPGTLHGESEDLIRGSSNIPLSEFGRQQAHQLGPRLRNVQRIFTSDLDRAAETAHIIGSYNRNGAPIIPTKALRPWYLGSHEGQPTNQVLADINDRIINRPDEPVPGRGPHSTEDGESFNSFLLGRLVPFVRQQVQNWKQGQTDLDVTHYRDIRALQSVLKAKGLDTGQLDAKEMIRRGDLHPGDLLRLYPPTMKLTSAKSSEEGDGIYFARHGATAYNSENRKGAV